MFSVGFFLSHVAGFKVYFWKGRVFSYWYFLNRRYQPRINELIKSRFIGSIQFCAKIYPVGSRFNAG
jgi:hypothetical protein